MQDWDLKHLVDCIPLCVNMPMMGGRHAATDALLVMVSLCQPPLPPAQGGTASELANMEVSLPLGKRLTVRAMSCLSNASTLKRISCFDTTVAVPSCGPRPLQAAHQKLIDAGVVEQLVQVMLQGSDPIAPCLFPSSPCAATWQCFLTTLLGACF